MYATLSPCDARAPLPARAATACVRSAAELRSALRLARSQSLTLDSRGLDRVLRVEPGSGLVELQAATPWAELDRVLGPQGIDLTQFSRSAELPATVGESVSQAAAGPDGRPATAHVLALTIATPDGELHRAAREENSSLMRLALGGQGAIGIIYSLTLSIASLLASCAAARASSSAPGQTEPERPLRPGDHRQLAERAERRLAEHRLSCLVPPSEVEGFLAEVHSTAAERRLELRGIALRQLRSEDSCLLNWASRDWIGVTIRFSMKAGLAASVNAAEVRRALLAAALARRGSFPLSETRDATRAQLQSCYPRLAEFIAGKRRYDPAERLQNTWYRGLRLALQLGPCAGRWSA